MRTPLYAWRAALLTTLGISASACGGEAVGDDITNAGGSGGASGAATAGATAAGRGSFGGNVQVGGATTGGATTGGAAFAGAGGAGPAGAGGAIAVGGEGTGGAGLPQCVNPRPYGYPSASAEQSGALPRPPGPGTALPALGFVQCDGGWIHRPAATECPSFLPRADAALPPDVPNPQCKTDADCTDRPHGWCSPSPPPGGGTYCAYGCVRDSDCEAGSICLCGDPVGSCVPSNCRVDADCGAGLCAGTPVNICTLSYDFGCQSAADECTTAQDCAAGEVCQFESGRRTCHPSPVCGRPFLVDGQARTAAARTGAGWGDAVSNAIPLDADVRAEIARYFTDIGLMEHASVAAFARFTLELLSLGAPAELVRDTQLALGDEIAHTQLCFGLAASYAGSKVTAGPLALDGALQARTRPEIVRTAFLEACIGETLAAVEARLALESTCEEHARRALERIAADEARHAELGWRFVKWALETFEPAEARELASELSSVLQEELARVPTAPAVRERDAVLAAHGVTSPFTRWHARQLALHELVVPWMDAVLASVQTPAAA